MSSKLKAYWAAGVGSVAYLIGYIAGIPPSLQNDFAQSLQAFFPLHTRPYIVPAAHALTTVSAVYALRHAAKSGPQTPPTNPPSK